MSKLVAAYVRHLNINQGQTDIYVTLDGAPEWVYEAKACPDGGTAYLALDGDVGNFFYHNPRGETGFGGSIFTLRMKDGSLKDIKGPWSSSPSTMNRLFSLDDPLVDCREEYTVRYVRKSALICMGVDMVYRNYCGGDDQTKDGYWEARRKV